MASVPNEQLVLLHQELAALARAGMPLDDGLRSLAHDLPGGLGKAAHALAEQLERGEPLDQALHSHPPPQQSVYAAVLAAGIRSGQVSRALEAIVASAKVSEQLRRNLTIELVYPLMLLVLGFVLLMFSVNAVVPIDVEASGRLDIDNPAITSLSGIAEGIRAATLPLAALIVLCVVATFWFLNRRLTWNGSLPRRGGLLARFRVEQSLARFFDLLALQVEHSLPLPQALMLAGQGSGCSELAAAAARASQRLQQGQTDFDEPPLPATVRWLVGRHAGNRALLLRREAEQHRQRAIDLADALTRWLPLVLTVTIGSVFLLLLAVLNLGPLLNAFYQMSAGSY